MKKALFISFFLGFTFISYSQLNFFLPDSNAYFSVSPYKFWFQGDTAINNKKYKKVFKQIGGFYADFNKAVYYSAVREDTLNERIYCIQKDDGIERLIADFSLSAGDTISVYSYFPFESPIIERVKIKSIDSILIANNYRKRLNIDETQGCLGEGESWIEGIGSTHGLFFPYSVVPDLSCAELLCFYINDTLIYQNPNYNTCYKNFYFSVIEKTQDFFKIHPTIATDYLFIENPENSNMNYQYTIINSEGKKVKIDMLKLNNIEISNLENGIHFLLFYDKNKLISVNKFIKH